MQMRPTAVDLRLLVVEAEVQGVSGDMGYYGNWWTNDEYDASKGYAMDLSYGNGSSHLFQRTKSIGMSIRCIKNNIFSVKYS